MKRVRDEKGFTLIEIIVVIIILGILSVIAIPKYLDLTTAAEQGVAKGVTAALRGAISIKHATFLLSGTTYTAGDVTANIDAEGLTMDAAANVITATFVDSGGEYNWAYLDTDTTDDIPATVTPSW